MKKIKIVHINVTPMFTGAQLFTVQLFSALPNDLYDKYAIVSSSVEVSDVQRNELIEKYASVNAKIIWLSSLQRDISIHDIGCFRDMYKLFKKYRFDIVHTNSTKPGVIARIAARLAGVGKIIHTVHGIAYHAHLSRVKRVFYYSIEAFSSLWGDYIVSVNKFYLRYYRWIPFCKLLTIYNGVDFSRFSSEVTGKRRRWIDADTTGKRDFRILFVGRLYEQKDPLTLLKGFKLFIEQHSDDDINYTLSVVGDGPLFNACQRFCAGNGLQSSVTLHGWSTNTAIHYQSADLFVCPSIYEAFGFTFVEAAYYGLPIIATNVEGIPEVVIDGEMGCLVAARSPQLLADAMYKVMSNPELYERFSRASRSSVMQRFSLDKMVRSYREIYERG